MSRKLTGRIVARNGRFQASVPTGKGSKRRISRTFDERQAAQAWLDAAIGAVEAGGDIRDLAPTVQGEAAGEPLSATAVASQATSSPVTRTSLRTIAEDYVERTYVKMGAAQYSREVTVRCHVKKMAAYFEERDIAMEEITTEHVEDFYLSLAFGSDAVAGAKIPAGIDLEQRVTITETGKIEGIASKSTIKRRKAAGELAYEVDADGVHRFRVGDLYALGLTGEKGADGLRRGPTRKAGYCRAVRKDIRTTFHKVCDFARGRGIVVNPHLSEVPLPRGDRPRSRRRQPISLTECALLAKEMHVVHQMAFWLIALCGLRRGEVFGLRVGDITDTGAGTFGVMRVREQGGSTFTERDLYTRAVVSSSTKQELKTTQSFRTIVVPVALMDDIRRFINVFHADADGIVDPDTRLLPGLRTVGEAGAQALWSALKAAAAAANVTSVVWDEQEEPLFEFRPKDGRATSITHVAQIPSVRERDRKRFAGHTPGDDVHSRVYVLDDPELREMKQIARKLDKRIAKQLDGVLMVPSMLRCTTGAQPALALRAAEIDAHLVDLGWLITPTDGAEDLLDAAQIAELLGISTVVARRYLERNVITSRVWKKRGRGSERRAKLPDVVAYKAKRDAHVTLTDLAHELGISYHRVYNFALSRGMKLEDVGYQGSAVAAGDQAAIRAHFRDVEALAASVAAIAEVIERLGLSRTEVNLLIAAGDLVEGAKMPDGRRTVTRESLRRFDADATRLDRRGVHGQAVSWSQACVVTGLSSQHLEALVADGELEKVYLKRKRHITHASLCTYVARTDPGRLVLQAAVG